MRTSLSIENTNSTEPNQQYQKETSASGRTTPSSFPTTRNKIKGSLVSLKNTVKQSANNLRSKPIFPFSQHQRKAATKQPELNNWSSKWRSFFITKKEGVAIETEAIRIIKELWTQQEEAIQAIKDDLEKKEEAIRSKEEPNEAQDEFQQNLKKSEKLLEQTKVDNTKAAIEKLQRKRYEVIKKFKREFLFRKINPEYINTIIRKTGAIVNRKENNTAYIDAFIDELPQKGYVLIGQIIDENNTYLRWTRNQTPISQQAKDKFSEEMNLANTVLMDIFKNKYDVDLAHKNSYETTTVQDIKNMISEAKKLSKAKKDATDRANSLNNQGTEESEPAEKTLSEKDSYSSKSTKYDTDRPNSLNQQKTEDSEQRESENEPDWRRMKGLTWVEKYYRQSVIENHE